jgi:hypothetical protein
VINIPPLVFSPRLSANAMDKTDSIFFVVQFVRQAQDVFQEHLTLADDACLEQVLLLLIGRHERRNTQLNDEHRDEDVQVGFKLSFILTLLTLLHSLLGLGNGKGPVGDGQDGLNARGLIKLQVLQAHLDCALSDWVNNQRRHLR